MANIRSKPSFDGIRLKSIDDHIPLLSYELKMINLSPLALTICHLLQKKRIEL